MQVKCKDTPAKAKHDGCVILWYKIGRWRFLPTARCIMHKSDRCSRFQLPNPGYCSFAGLGCRLGRRFCLRQRSPPETRAPQHLILDLKLFCDAFTGRHLLNQLKKHRFSLFVQIGKIAVQLAGGQQLRVQRLAVLPEIPQMPLAPNADGPLFFSGQLQTWNEIIALQLILKSVLFVVDVFFHDVILQI